MKVELINYHQKQARLQLRIPYEATEYRAKIKSIKGFFYHKPQRLWSIPNTKENKALLEAFFKDDLVRNTKGEGAKRDRYVRTEEDQVRLNRVEQHLVLAGKALNTIKPLYHDYVHQLKTFTN